MHVQQPMGEHAPFESIHPFLCLANSNGSIIAPLWTPKSKYRSVLTQGNQTFADGELFATSLRGILQDVYLYKGGTLTKYMTLYLAQPIPGLYSSSNHPSLPNTSIQTVSQGVPTRVSFPSPSTSKTLLMACPWSGSSHLCSPLLLDPTLPPSLEVS